MICWYEGGERSNGEIGRGRVGIQPGISSVLVALIGLKNLAMKLVYVKPSKAGNDMALFLTVFLT